MGHILVLPEDLRVKLNAANLDANTHNKWVAIGVNTVDDMINRIVNDLNHAYPVLSITSTREENKNTIKSRIDSTGNVSMFVGYFENDKGYVDALTMVSSRVCHLQKNRRHYPRLQEISMQCIHLMESTFLIRQDSSSARAMRKKYT